MLASFPQQKLNSKDIISSLSFNVTNVDGYRCDGLVAILFDKDNPVKISYLSYKQAYKEHLLDAYEIADIKDDDEIKSEYLLLKGAKLAFCREGVAKLLPCYPEKKYTINIIDERINLAEIHIENGAYAKFNFKFEEEYQTHFLYIHSIIKARDTADFRRFIETRLDLIRINQNKMPVN